MLRKMLFALFGAAAIFVVVMALEQAAAHRDKSGNAPANRPNAASPSKHGPAGEPCIGCDFPSL